MTQPKNISTNQAFSMLFLSSIITFLSYSPKLAQSANLWDHVFSALLCLFLSFILILPILKLYKSFPAQNIVEHSFKLMGKFGIIISLIYAIYYILCSAYALSRFSYFTSSVISPDISLFMLSLFIIFSACYGAKCGIEGLARASGIILFLILTTLIFIIISLIQYINPINYAPLMLWGTQDTINGIYYNIGLFSALPALLMLLPFIKGKIKRASNYWLICTFGFLIILISITVGTLGEFLKTHIFPIYTATSIANISVLKRLDAIYLGVFATGLFVKLSLFILLFSMAITNIWSQKAKNISIIIGGILTLILSLCASNFKNFMLLFYNMKICLFSTLLTGFFIPLIYLICYKIKKEK